MMHVLDYDRALGELLELDDTIRASIERASIPHPAYQSVMLTASVSIERSEEDWRV